MEKQIEEIIYREDLYPRLKHDPLIVQKYAEDLTVLPPIEINQHNILKGFTQYYLMLYRPD